MKKGWIASLVVLFFCSGIASAEEAVSLKTQRDKVSYLLGRSTGTDLKNQSVDIDADIFVKGFKDALAGNKSALSEVETREAMEDFQEEMAKQREEEAKKVAEKNKKEGEAFFAENSKKEGVVSLPSGLQYKILKEGDGPTPKAADTVLVNYKGTFIDGTEFDNSYKRNQPAALKVGGVIPGWKEALQLMKVGSQWQLFVPHGLAYGARGVKNKIGPNAGLIFEVELMSIEEPGHGQKGMKEMPKDHGDH